jgi:hypothetical protein
VPAVRAEQAIARRDGAGQRDRGVALRARERPGGELPRARDPQLVLAGDRVAAPWVTVVDPALEAHVTQDTGRVVETTNGGGASVGDVPDDAAGRR